ncbi:unnamed protein product [Trypanosoma congolense IL3000]|uniref:WGS project CAEQ00000000 data, annotated contig 1721 n=1 Tax=Trypanosoma congolense (strain IL3000) TaxID=1068625 RepID=F9W8A4_TRYCI|nr:unnamed protein product [Trypanosoma congolense IL3000]
MTFKIPYLTFIPVRCYLFLNLAPLYYRHLPNSSFLPSFNVRDVFLCDYSPDVPVASEMGFPCSGGCGAHPFLPCMARINAVPVHILLYYIFSTFIGFFPLCYWLPFIYYYLMLMFYCSLSVQVRGGPLYISSLCFPLLMCMGFIEFPESSHTLVPKVVAPQLFSLFFIRGTVRSEPHLSFCLPFLSSV